MKTVTKLATQIEISYVTLFPELIEQYLGDALIKRAVDNNILKFNFYNLRNFSTKGGYKSVDDIPYGGGDGMVIQAEPLIDCYQHVKAIHGDFKNKKTRVIYVSPQGKKLDHSKIKELLSYEHLVLVSGRYAGLDQRFISEYIDEEISIGDYVLSGGELACLVMTEAISRFLPGVLGDENSAQLDSFSDHELTDGLLEAPQFSKPQNFQGLQVPEVLYSGNHQKIGQWRKMMSVLVTLSKREDLLGGKPDINWTSILEFYKNLSAEDLKVLKIENLESKIHTQIQKVISAKVQV